MPELLKIQGLKLSIATKEILRGVSLALEAGQTLGIVGESGSGKSMTALAVMGLLPRGARITGGCLEFEGSQLRSFSQAEYRDLRGAQISMVFQEPFTCMNPVQRIVNQVAEPLQLHAGLALPDALKAATAWLEKVGIPDAAQKGRQYPHQWSGGMRQRAMIAMALACSPKLLIADEPTTALDVTVQAQILALLKGMAKELGVAVILISHDLGVVYSMAERMAVMKDGVVVEEGLKEALFEKPSHPYTRSLVDSYAQWAGAA